jgi:hypothetical protein
MTAIAYRDGVMAADTMETIDVNVKRLDSQKVSKYRGHLIGISGEACPENVAFAKWYFGGERKPWPEHFSFTALVVNPDGAIEIWDKTANKLVINDEFWAVGSGMEFCLGAMAAGATAKEAVQIAIERCPTVSGKVQWKKLHDRKKESKHT